MFKVYHVLHDLVPFVQFKKCEKNPWRNVPLVKLQACINEIDTSVDGCFEFFN